MTETHTMPVTSASEGPINAGGTRDDCGSSNIFFAAHLETGRVVTQGSFHASFGHQLPAETNDAADGIFAAWSWNGARLTVHNDRYGFQPLFWSRLPGDGVCISPSLISLVEHGAPTTFDTEALAVFFRLGYFLGNDTPFAAIKAIPPNAEFTWQSGVLKCRGRYPQTPGVSVLSRDTAIDIYIDLFAQAMARRVHDTGKFAVPISGGRDSRHILLELHRTGCQPDACVSALDHPPDPNDDPRIATALCQELGFPLTIIEQRLSPFAAQQRKNPATHFCATAHGWYLAVADYLNGHFSCAYDGIAGDVLSQSSFLTPTIDAAFRSGSPQTARNALLLRESGSWRGVADLLKGPLRPCLDAGTANAHIDREIERHLAHPNPVASFIFWNRTRRQIALAPFSLLSKVSKVYAPFLDHDLYDFMSTLPSGMLLDHRFHDDAIARAYPAFAHVPYARKPAPRVDDASTRAHFTAEAARAFLFRKPSRLARNFAPRAKLLAWALSLGHVKPWISPWMIYLDQLELLADAHRTR